MGVREALLRSAIASAAQIDEALARQQLYGADIVTNLLELLDLDEAAVQRALSEAYGMAVAPSGELPYAAGSAIELVPRAVASDLNIYPYRLDDGVLTLIASGPLSERSAVELGFALKVQLRALFAVAPRVRQAIARDYAFALDRRTQKALAKLDRSSRVLLSEAPPPMVDVRSMSQFPRPPSIAPFGFPENWADAVTPDAAKVHAETARQPAVRSFDVNDLREPPETSRSIFDDGGAPEFPGAGSELLATGTRTSAPDSGAQPRHHQRRRGPYTVADAKLDLQETQDSDELLDIFFDYAAQYFDYAAVFTLHGHAARPREARGTGQSASALAQSLPLESSPALQRVSESRTWLLGNLQELDPGLARALLRDTELQCLLLPVVVRGRCVAVLYGGFDSEPVELEVVGELLAFCPLVAHAFEQAILARKGDPRARAGSAPRQRARRFATPAREERARALAEVLANPREPETGSS